MTTATDVQRHLNRLKRLRGPVMIQPVTQAVFAAAQDLAVDASLSITRGAVSGAKHQPSAPGEPPNADTHFLARGIEAESTAPLKAETSSNAPYSAAQEFGSAEQNLPERPFMAPAAKRARPRAVARVVKAVQQVLRQNRGK